jgi:2-polyprenyl-3-methyl-5-hydroxy-6-metoxy-1,4-benzoquinol methylase
VKLTDRIEYFMWAARQWPQSDTSCPACGSTATSLLRRKALVTALVRCQACCLRFRVPKDSPRENETFYQSQYQQGFTTDCPGADELAKLVHSGFRDTEKSYAAYLNVLNSAGLQPGDAICDFGCSWGYGSWQLMQAGYRVFPYEISRPRARYAEEKLGCHMLPDMDHVPEKMDCLFGAHVIEHLPDPNIIWEAAQKILKPHGKVVLFTPNGEPELAEQRPDSYHRLWGKVHPLLLSADALSAMADRFGFVGCGYSSPYEPSKIAHFVPGQLAGDELLYIARRATPGWTGKERS